MMMAEHEKVQFWMQCLKSICHGMHFGKRPLVSGTGHGELLSVLHIHPLSIPHQDSRQTGSLKQVT